MKTFNIIDRFTNEVVATRKTQASATKWSNGLNEGLVLFQGASRYVVSKV